MTSERITSFLQRVDQLPKGDRTALKREAGTMLLQADGRAVRAFYQCLPSQVKQWEEERYFAAACLHCLWGRCCAPAYGAGFVPAWTGF